MASSAPRLERRDAALPLLCVAAAAIAPTAITAAVKSENPAAVRVVVEAPPGDTLPSAMPPFTLRALDVDPADRPITLTLQVSTRADFVGPLLFEGSATGDSARVFPSRPLPSLTLVFWRARALTARGEEVLSPVSGPRVTPPWVRLVVPNPTVGSTLTTRRPTFRWTAAHILEPPGPWVFFVTIENLARGDVVDFGPLGGTQFTIPTELETNTSYRWAVTAGLPTGESIVVRSVATFVILEEAAPRVTLLYQNFPNPFPNPVSSSTCLWFDLHARSRVRLTIHDIRGNLVRTLIPTSQLGDFFEAGRYGRAVPGGAETCDPRFAWDGTGDNARRMPPGVYLARLRTEAHESFKRILYRGR